MDEEAVRKYVQRAQSIIESSPQMDEANTKAAVLQDFLEVLGWEIPTNTQLEYPVKAFGKTYKVDYALVSDGTPVAFIEAKGVDTPLTERHREQLAAYLKNEDVNWGILTNGREYEFYQRRIVNSKVTVTALAEARLEILIERLTILEAYTTAAIQTGDSEKIATRINQLKEAKESLETEKDELAAEITELVIESVSDVISSQAESEAKEMIDRLVQEIETKIESDSTSSQIRNSGDSASGTTESEESTLGEEATDRSTNGSTDRVFDTSGRYIVRFSTDRDEIVVVSGQKQHEAMVEAATYLIENYDLLEQIGPLPWIPGRKKAIINDTPEWEEAAPEYRKLGDECYLDTKLSKSAKKREIRRMAGKCGLGVTFEGDW